MNPVLKRKIIEVCDRKIAQKGDGVGVSFYAFSANRNDDPEQLMEVAEWWIRTHRLDHFEKAMKVRAMVLDRGSPASPEWEQRPQAPVHVQAFARTT